ncbi:hypothetical protein Sarmat_00728 [Rickettsiales endosymbiont of Paramecium tredecaurelia]|uniref:hypothetical protein n=1 Tax=Candidatus Sarmatiella mevalonica TaxID=2770581 RepID=UPI0019220861|nr:hypothetical protein [Candidatus Sarmatiella mevalonica]MBL3284870.1 hypothetical protein [Candidatus Sarmatiella mevalonica]
MSKKPPVIREFVFEDLPKESVVNAVFLPEHDVELGIRESYYINLDRDSEEAHDADLLVSSPNGEHHANEEAEYADSFRDSDEKKHNDDSDLLDVKRDDDVAKLSHDQDSARNTELLAEGDSYNQNSHKDSNDLNDGSLDSHSDGSVIKDDEIATKNSLNKKKSLLMTRRTVKIAMRIVMRIVKMMKMVKGMIVKKMVKKMVKVIGLRMTKITMETRMAKTMALYLKSIEIWPIAKVIMRQRKSMKNY